MCCFRQLRKNLSAFYVFSRCYDNLIEGTCTVNIFDPQRKATWRCIYDLDMASAGDPVRVAMIAREEHYEDNPDSPLLMKFTYTDGFGRVAMEKTHAQEFSTPPGTSESWIGTGKTVYNNKGKVVMQYEPYYSGSHSYDPAVQAVADGVSPKMHYDALGRLTRTDMPDGTYTKTEWSGWLQSVYDSNDTVTDTTWFTDRNVGGMGSDEQDAAVKAEDHHGSPTVMHLDTLGRPFYTIQHDKLPDTNPSDPWLDFFYESYVVLDITGNRLAIYDARLGTQGSFIPTLTYQYNMVRAICWQGSVDSGLQMMIMDAGGQPLYSWNVAGYAYSVVYDELRRPIEKLVDGARYEMTSYGEGVSSDKVKNLRGQVYQSYQSGGLTQVEEYDFKGLPIEAFTEQ